MAWEVVPHPCWYDYDDDAYGDDDYKDDDDDDDFRQDNTIVVLWCINVHTVFPLVMKIMNMMMMMTTTMMMTKRKI